VALLSEVAAWLAYAVLLRLLVQRRVSVPRVFRLVLSTTALSHVMPGGAAGGAGLGFQLLTADGVPEAEAGFALATEAMGSAIVLNLLLWVALLLTIPFAGLHPVYVVIALVGLFALLAVGALVLLFTRGEERAVRIVRTIGRRLPRVGADHAEQVVRQVADSVAALTGDRHLLKQAFLWAALNWLLDAASLWCCLAALGHRVNPVELFAAYGVANVLAVIPLTPGGLGVIDASSATLLVSFGTTSAVATLGVLGWRLLNFWLPIPVGAIAYLTTLVPPRVAPG
jgi:uncharacterized protein (TIRG00374 family)